MRPQFEWPCYTFNYWFILAFYDGNYQKYIGDNITQESQFARGNN